MRPGRNEPCFCGSGKKYKKCCYPNDQKKDDKEIGVAGLEPSQDDLDALFDLQELTHAMNQLREYGLRKKPHIKEYYKIRKLHGEIVDAMVRYHEDGHFKKIAKVDSSSPIKHDPSLYLLESEYNFDTREGVQGFYDMMIYKQAPNMNCITEDFIQKHRYRKPEKVELLYSMLDSKLGLFEITETDYYEGYAYLKDVFTGAEYKIIDVGLSGDINYDEFYIYTRIINYQGISFGTGLNLVFTKTDSFIKNHIRQHKKDYTPNGELVRFTQLYNRFSQNPDKVEIVATRLK